MLKKLSHYNIIKPLYIGSWASVYVARDYHQNRLVAIKLLPRNLIADQRIRNWITKEARIIASLSHPNIAPVYEVGETSEFIFIVMPYIEGRTLAHIVQSGPLRLNEISYIGMQVAQALDAAHSQGLIHSGIKPQNIIISDTGYVKVTDFGLNTLIQEATTVGVLLPQRFNIDLSYLSPEQVQLENLDPRSDLFSLGIVLYEMLCGRNPFKTEDEVNTLYAILKHSPSPVTEFRADAPAELERIVSKALKKSKEERYQTSRDLLKDLNTFVHLAQIGVGKPPAHNQDLTSEEEIILGEGVVGDELVGGYAIAKIKDHPEGSPLFINNSYTLLAGVSWNLPEHFEGKQASILLPLKEGTVEVEIAVQAQGMDIAPDWYKTLLLRKHEECQLVEFYLIPRREGNSEITIEFYYHRIWLAQIEFKMEVRQEKVAASR